MRQGGVFPRGERDDEATAVAWQKGDHNAIALKPKAHSCEGRTGIDIVIVFVLKMHLLRPLRLSIMFCFFCVSRRMLPQGETGWAALRALIGATIIGRTRS